MENKNWIDVETVRKWWHLLHNDGNTYEIRLIGDKTYSGYFTDIEEAIPFLLRVRDINVFCTVNPCDSACMSQVQGNKIIAIGKNPTTSGADIIARNWILIDVDPGKGNSKTKSGINATDEEKAYARATATSVYNYLKSQGFYDPVICDSANGYHLYYRVSLANSPENTELVKHFLESLDMFFSNEHCSIDTAVFDPNRISKLIGSRSGKGRDTKERPQRMSKVLSYPEEIKTNDIEFIRKVAKSSIKMEESQKPSFENRFSGEPFDLDEFIKKYDIEIEKTSKYGSGEKLILRECPFNHEHKQAAIFRSNTGAIAFKCFHNSCQQYGWRDFRLHYDPNAYSRKDYREYVSKHRYDKGAYPVREVEVIQKEDPRKGNKWMVARDVRYVDISQLPFVETGITKLDKGMMGLFAGDVTIISGLAGSGKTSMLNLIILNAIDNGHKVSAWSGELQDFRFMNWMRQMAAGKNNVLKNTHYDNVFFAPEDIARRINEWLGDNFHLYNNAYGNKWSQLQADIYDEIDKNHPELVVVDNLAAMDLSTSSAELLGKQKTLINWLKDTAKEKNIHVVLVAHPRKEQAFRMLRMDSIAGSSDLTNLADNVIIVHRGGSDLRKRMSEFFPPHIVEEYSAYDVLVEVVKNRSHGFVGDRALIGMYYEVESKRFLNEISECKIYGWDNTAPSIYPDISLEALPGWLDDEGNKEQEDLPF